MAITPASLTTLSTNELAVASRVEAAIDAELRLKFETGKAVAIRNVLIRPAVEENPRVLEEVKSRFDAAGWDIVEYDSKEGIWLSMSER